MSGDGIAGKGGVEFGWSIADDEWQWRRIALVIGDIAALVLRFGFDGESAGVALAEGEDGDGFEFVDLAFDVLEWCAPDNGELDGFDVIAFPVGLVERRDALP
jgi:hypothetical protein